MKPLHCVILADAETGIGVGFPADIDPLQCVRCLLPAVVGDFATAHRAAAIEETPHVLDTLAESLFINGKTEQAIEVALRALELARTNRAYYNGQLERFQTARDNPTSN